MLTKVEELREKIKTLATELQGIKDTVDKEERQFSDEEIKKSNSIADELDGLEISLEAAIAEERTNNKLNSLKQSDRPPVRPDVTKMSVEDRKFRSFGDQLMAVVRYYAFGEQNYKLRAATGMSESVPSDGGLA